MLVKRVEAKSEELLDPGSPAWRQSRSDNVVLSPAPVEMQPTDYVRVSWTGRPYGILSSMRVTAVHNGDGIFFRLVWEDDSVNGQTDDINEFADAAAVLFPIAADAPLLGMGTKGKAVNAWFWRANSDGAQNVAAEGIGTTQRRDDAALSVKARHTRGRWDIVISRALNGKRAPSGTAKLKPGATSKVAFAVWQGGNQERAGIKAFSLDWQELEIEA